jgi:hypothetical protein
MRNTFITGLIFALTPLVCQAQVATLNITRQVLVTKTAGEFAPAKQGQSVVDGQGVRTLKRSLAELKFRDKSILRLAERTDLIVHDARALKRLGLQKGLVWLRVTQGNNTRLETPNATAISRGTEFEVEVRGPNETILSVYNHEVELRHGQEMTLVKAGERARVLTLGDNTIVTKIEKIPLRYLPEAFGGGQESWWESMETQRGLLVLPGSDVSLPLRSDVMNEAVQNEAARPVAPQRLASLDRERLLRIARESVVPEVENALASDPSLRGIGDFQSRFSAQSTETRFTIAEGDLRWLEDGGVRNTGDLFTALRATGAGFGLSTRAIYAPGSVAGPRSAYRRLDRNDTSATPLAVGALLSIIADPDRKFVWIPPEAALIGYATSSNPRQAGIRGQLTGMLGRSRLRWEANGAADALGSESQLASVALLERKLDQNLTVFAGRRRFYHGPVFQNAQLSQLIADRYTGAGATFRRGDLRIEGAYLHDANPDTRGAQAGALGSVIRQLGGGLLGAHYLRAPGVSGTNGYSVSLAYPAIPNLLDLYGEAGRGPDRAQLQSVGIYFPQLFQSSGADVFLEYNRHAGVGRGMTLTAVHQNDNGSAARVFLQRGDLPGLRGQWRFGLGFTVSVRN